MARRPRLFASGLLYHVIARGNRRQATFLTNLDYQTYCALLTKYRNRYGVVIHAYCLMPNHVHLLVQTSDTPLARFMQGLQQSYTQRFNRFHDKVGHLFQGRYKAIVCDRDEYLATLIRYIHLNPVRAGLVEDPGAYPYSGHRAYLRGDGTGLIDPRLVVRMLGGREAYRRFVLAGIGEGHEDRYYPSGPDQMLGTVRSAQRPVHGAARGAGALSGDQVDVAVAELAGKLSMDPGALRSPDRSQPLASARAAVSFVLVRRMGYRVADVADALGRSPNTISTLVSHLAHRLESDHHAALDLSRLGQDI